jgi:hypothetical protein
MGRGAVEVQYEYLVNPATAWVTGAGAGTVQRETLGLWDLWWQMKE